MKAMKLKSCFLLIGLLLVCNVYAQELCRGIFSLRLLQLLIC